MTEEKYKKLNNYLNIIFKELEKNDKFFLENLTPIAITSERVFDFFEQYEYEEDFTENNLTFEDIYIIAREIIESIDEKYLPVYDKIIDDGTLDFNYNDVIGLIHEFIHLINKKISNSTNNRYLFAEFISIYFEIYAQKYLIQNYNVSKDSIGIYQRLSSIKRNSLNIVTYSIPFFAYLNSGNLNENSYEFTNQFFIKESKERFEKECENILENCEKTEKNYQKEILYEIKFDEGKFGKYLVNELGFNSHYRYLLGSLLAYYVIDNVDIKNMVALNDFIDTEESAQISPIDLLYKFGIDIDEFLNKSLEIIEKILEDKKKMR